jgi:hypothetical protein
MCGTWLELEGMQFERSKAKNVENRKNKSYSDLCHFYLATLFFRPSLIVAGSPKS